jgi:hypothetical protein
MANAINMQASSERKASTAITKTKYKAFKEKLATYLKENDVSHMTDDILEVMCDAFLFDPEKSAYDKEKVMRKCLETGLNTYEIYTRKYYEKNKEVIDQKSVERTRIRRAANKELLRLVGKTI